MVTEAIEEGVVVLNSVKFPIEGFVRESLISRFPTKLTIGDYDYANEQILSNWIISDQRGGLLIEEMDESIHQDRYFWSTCDTRFRSNIMLPPLATLLTAPTTPDAPTIVNADMELTTGWLGDGGRSDTEKHGGTYSWRLVTQDSSAQEAYEDLATYVPGVEYTVTCYVKASSVLLDDLKIGINDGVDTTWSSPSASTGWVQLSVSKTLAINATRLRLLLYTVEGGAITYYAYFDDAAISVTAITVGTATCQSNFNAESYSSFGTILVKLNAGNDGFDLVADMGATITALIQNGTNLFILLGDANNYWYMTTGEVFAETDEADATLGIWWDSKLFIFDSAGACQYTATPAQASPSMTANGSLPIADNELQRVRSYFNADGDDIIYCSTKVGTFAHDTDNAKFLHTAVKVPNHPTAGKGFVVWHDGLYTSAGLNVIKYIAGGTAVITKMGLDQDDGLPALRSGEIVEFIEGYNEFFALIDSTYEGTGSRSQVVSYDGKGWRTWWEATANNKNMYSGIVTTKNAYQLLFSTTDGMYKIALQRTSLNPKKISTYAYAATGVHIPPRFDAGTKAFPKLATKLTVFLADCSASEDDDTVTITYQIDQAAGALTSAWTTLLTAQTSNGKKEVTFGTDAGIEFYDIQFRAALARRTTGTTPEYYSPIIKGMVLSFVKLLGRKKAWNITINTAEAGLVSSEPKALTDAIATILATNTLIPFTFRGDAVSAETHYVMIQPYYGFTPTGRNWEGTYNLTAIEV